MELLKFCFVERYFYMRTFSIILTAVSLVWKCFVNYEMMINTTTMWHCKIDGEFGLEVDIALIGIQIIQYDGSTKDCYC